VVAFGSGASLGAGVAGCNDSSEEGAPPLEADAGLTDASTDGSGGPRRPARRYYMTRTEKRCEVYSVEGDQISPAMPAPCPAVIEVGERIRLAGRVCLREGTPQREQPVVCPGDLLYAEEVDRELAMRRKAAEADGGATDAGAEATLKTVSQSKDAGRAKRDAGR
jgi:hypothetical protein